jgi:hypothetical protein
MKNIPSNVTGLIAVFAVREMGIFYHPKDSPHPGEHIS